MKRIHINLLGRKIGFTLTELLIVVIIIGVLATLALPMLVKTLEKAKVGEATSNLNLIRTGQKIYFLEWGEFSPTIGDLNVEDPNDETSRYFYYSLDDEVNRAENFTAIATRGGEGAISAPEPYDGDNYQVQKNGTIRGRFTTGEEL